MKALIVTTTRLLCCLLVAAPFGVGTARAQSPAGPVGAPRSTTTAPADEQDAADEHRWDIDIHGGYSGRSFDRGGRASLPAAGSTVNGLLSLSTFLVGDGARLFNQNQASAFGSGAPTIVALDPVLQSAFVQRNPGGTFGIRLTRAIGGHFGVEIAGDRSAGRLAITSAALSGLEATRASYAPAVLRTLAAAAAPSADAAVSVSDQPVATQTFVTASLIVRLREKGRIVPYLSAGMGVVFNQGDTLPAALIAGEYQFGSTAQVFGSDTVNLSYSRDDHSLAWTGGAGLTLGLNSRFGIRLDARARMYQNSSATLVAISPGRSLESTGAAFPSVTAGALQFNSTGPLTAAGTSGFTTFAGKSLQGQVAATAGLFLRF